jgi:hypothetical protein
VKLLISNTLYKDLKNDKKKRFSSNPFNDWPFDNGSGGTSSDEASSRKSGYEK